VVASHWVKGSVFFSNVLVQQFRITFGLTAQLIDGEVVARAEPTIADGEPGSRGRGSSSSQNIPQIRFWIAKQGHSTELPVTFSVLNQMTIYCRTFVLGRLTLRDHREILLKTEWHHNCTKKSGDSPFSPEPLGGTARKCVIQEF
jgi:hypothetical protein